MTDQEKWIPAERVARFLQGLLDEAVEENANPTYLSALTGIEKRKIWEIMNGLQWAKGRRTPYLNVSFDLVDKMLVHMGRVDLWHTEFADLYWADSLPKRKICKECGEIKSVREMRRLTSAGHPTTCIECLDGVAA